MVILWKTKRLVKNKMLFAFYIFGLFTLGCRAGVFTTEIVYIISDK